MGSSMPREAITTITRMIACGQRLVDSVEEDDKSATLDALKENAILSIRLLRMVPGLNQLGADQLLEASEETEFKKKLTSLLA